jgi:hypothetical protein
MIHKAKRSAYPQRVPPAARTAVVAAYSILPSLRRFDGVARLSPLSTWILSISLVGVLVGKFMM